MSITPRTPSMHPASASAASRPPAGAGLVFLYALTAFLCCLAVHLWVLPVWTRAIYHCGNEPLMNTPDAYFWLSGAVDFGKAVGTAPSLMLRWLGSLPGLTPPVVAWWSPALISCLVAVALVLWAHTLGYAEAGLFAGPFAVLVPGFFSRTHFGFYDTDMVTLLFPLLTSWALAQILRPCMREVRLTPAFLRSTWRELRAAKGVPEISPASAAQLRSLMLRALVAGLCIRFTNPWHVRIADCNAVLVILVLALTPLLVPPGKRGRMCWAMVLVTLAGQVPAWWGLPLALGLCLFCALRPEKAAAYTARAGTPLLVFALLSTQVASITGAAHTIHKYLEKYFSPVDRVFAAKEIDGLPYPAVAQSVAEVADTADTFLLFISKWTWPALLGGAGFILVCVVRPLSVLLSPLFFLALLGFLIGPRMAMFAGPAVGLGLSIPLCMAFERWLRGRISQGKQRVLAATVCLATTSVFQLPYFPEYITVTPSPPVTLSYCESMKDLRDTTPENAMLWTWWDWGYATQYFARRNTFADGGEFRHRGSVYFAAKILYSKSPKQASQLMRFCGDLNYRPWDIINKMTPQESESFLDSMSMIDYPFTTEEPQYLIINYNLLGVLEWISYYGSWNFETRTASHAKVRQITTQHGVDLQDGVLTFLNGNSLRLATIDVMTPQGGRHHDFQHQGYHLILRPDIGESYIMDTEAYSSMAVRLLVGDPFAVDITGEFEPVSITPFVRVYRALD